MYLPVFVGWYWQDKTVCICQYRPSDTCRNKHAGSLMMIDIFYWWFTYDSLILLSIILSYLWLTYFTNELLMIYLSIWALIYPTYDSRILLRTVVCTGGFGSGLVLFIDYRIQHRGTVVSVVQPMARQQQQPGRTPPLIIMDNCLSAFWNSHRPG